MFYAYILKNKDGKRYIGYTSDVQKRLKEHNSGLSESTKAYMPWICVYHEAYRSKHDAEQREQSLKLRGRAFYQLLKRIEASLGDEARLV